MGTLIGHVAPGFAFFFLGFWHLFNHIKLHIQKGNSYISLPWFPSSKIRYIELFFIILGSSMSISMELFIGPEKHQPFDSDGTIPSNHLHNFEHSSISITFLTYAIFAIVFDKIKPKLQHELTQLLAALAFGQQLFLFHLHSADHMGVEGQYHLLLQIVIAISLATTLIGINYPKSFLISFVRSSSIIFQGIWLIIMGYALWTPSLIPKGCFIHLEEGHDVVRCSGEESLHRAKSLVNILFSWFLIGGTIFVMCYYIFLNKFYTENIEYSSISKDEEKFTLQEDEEFDVESQKNKVDMKIGDHSSSLMNIGRSFGPIDIGR